MTCSPLCKGVLKHSYYPIIFPELIHVWEYQLRIGTNIQNRDILERKIQTFVTIRLLAHQINVNNDTLRKFEEKYLQLKIEK